MADYAFVSHWRIAAPINAVWDAIYRSEDWPTWWRDVLRVEILEHGDERGVGAVGRYTWKTALPYSFVFQTRTTYIEAPSVLELLAFGDLVGTGRWALTREGEVTHVRYDWNVSTNKRWMNLLAPLMRPAFAWNHGTVMRHGGRDLARHLNAHLISAR